MIYPNTKQKATQEDVQKNVDAITRRVALAVAFISVFIFFFKILFF